MGFQEAKTAQGGWGAAATIAPLVAGVVLLILGAINELYTKREPIIPPRVFKTRTTTAILVGSFIHSFTFMAASYYVPLYFQILGSSAVFHKNRAAHFLKYDLWLQRKNMCAPAIKMSAAIPVIFPQ